MRKLWKIVGGTALSILGLGYLGFLFVLPNVIDINEYKPLVQDLAKEQANLSVDFENAKIITTPLLGVGLKAENISVKLPDESQLFYADSFKTRVALPSLFVMTVKLSALEINNPQINLEIENDKQFKVVQLVEDLLNSGKEQQLEQDKEEVAAECWFNPAWIRIKVPNVVVNNYSVVIKDLKSKHDLTLTGEKLTAGYFNGKTAKVKTYAELFSDEDLNVTAKVDINTCLPPAGEALDEEDDPAERIDIPFVNPVTMYRKYDLKANLDTKLYVRSHGTWGHCNVENITMKVGHLTLPESYFKSNMSGTKINIDTDISPAKGQNIVAVGSFDYGKPKIDMDLKINDIKFNDMLILGRAFLDSLSIPHELSGYTAQGGINADCHIKTNFKKLKSNGSIVVKNGGISVRNLGNVISKANINILLDNNILDIKDSSLFVDQSKITVDGRIDEKSVADINIKADKIPLPRLFYAFAPKDLRNAYNFKSADATFELSIEGELKKAIATVKAGLDNLNLSDRAGNFVITDKKLSAEFFADAKNFNGKITNDNFALLLPKTKSLLSAPAFETEIADNNIVIKENKLNFNDKSSITYNGEIIDYNKLKSIVFDAKGNVSTDDMVKLIGREYKPFIHSAGSIPVKVTVNGDGKKQTVFAQALSDKSNFITPVDFIELKDKDIALQSVIDLKGNRIKIKKTGLFERTVSVDEKGTETVSLTDILHIDGTVEGSRINLIKINLRPLTGKIYVFPQSSFNVDGKAFIFGETSSPRMRGGFNLNNLSIPELLLNLRKAGIKFRSHDMDFSAEDLILNGSDIQVNGTMSMLPSPVLRVTDLKVASRYINLDKLMVVADKAMKYVPTSPAPAASQQPADIPVELRNGTINLTRIITGNIDVRDTFGRISLSRNVFYLNNLRTNVFKGNVRGNISMNLINSLLSIKLNGSGLDVDQAMVDGAGMKNTLSGTAEFKTDISLKGTTYEEQMKSLKGTVDFSVKNGQFGPFGKLENLILAENIRESQFFQTAIGGMLEGLLTIDTTHFSELAGNLSFDDGICYITPITSSGEILSLHIFGEFDLLRNCCDMKVRARMASLISNLLGPLAAINPANLIDSAASLNVVTAKAFSIFCEMVPEEELAILPGFANKYVDNSAMKFQIVVRGDVAKPLTLVKSFKWLASKTEFDRAVDFVNSLPEPVEGSEAATIEEAIAEHEALEAEKKTFTYKFKHLFDKDETDEIQAE